MDGGSNNLVEGNYIGTDITGTFGVGNADNGVQFDGGSNGNTIGGTTAGTRNIISGNGTIADLAGGIADYGGNDTLIVGNFVGTNAAGTAAIPNGWIGVAIDFGASDNTVGGTTAAARNLIDGTLGVCGLEFYQTGTGNLAEGNYIGVDATGTMAIGNAGSGVQFWGGGSGDNTVGGAGAGAGNVISGSGGNGIYLSTDSNLVDGNYIGTNASGTAGLPNDGAGIDVASPGNTIGGTSAGAGNLISGNEGQGILLTGTGATGNFVQGNFIGTNAAGSNTGLSPASSLGSRAKGTPTTARARTTAHSLAA